MEQITQPGEPLLLLTVILPARNEADVLPACLESLTAQSEPGFALGTDWELLVIDDHSTDDTRLLAGAFRGVTVHKAPSLDTSPTTGFNGKTNACWYGASQARGTLLLFTDADTLHTPGSLSRARHELEKHHAALLSYSPRQLVSGLAQRTLMPLVFAELAIAYPLKRVNDPADRTAAANGQFLLIQSEAYFAVGGHRAVGREVLEDVALARNVKRNKGILRFRYAPDALSTRMYRSTPALLEGWTKNLALLFPSPLAMAALRLLDILLLAGLPILALQRAIPLVSYQRTLIWLLWARVLWRFYARAAKSNFPAIDIALSILGIPLFCYLLIQSYFQVRLRKSVTWKGRTYHPGVNL